MTHRIAIGIALIGTCSCEPPAHDAAEIEAAAQAFVELAHAYDYAGLRAAATSDAEVVLLGRAMNIDGYEALLREMEQGGVRLPPVEGVAFNTEIHQDVAYTTWRTQNDWLEMTILRRERGRWLVARTFSMRLESGGP